MAEIKLINLFERLWKHITLKVRWQLFALLIFIILTSFFEYLSIGIIFPYLSILINPEKATNLYFLNVVMKKMEILSSKEIIYFITLIFIILIFFSTLLRILLNKIQTKVSFEIATDFASRTFNIILNQPYTIHINRNSSEVISALDKAGGLSAIILLPTLNIFSSAFILVTILLTLISLNPILILISILFFLLVYSIFIKLAKRKLEDNSFILSNESINVTKAIQESVGAIRNIILDDSKAYFLEKYKTSNTKLRSSAANISIISTIPRFFIEGLGMILIIILAFILSNGNEGIQNSLPLLGVLTFASQKILPLLQQIFNNWSNIKGGQSSFNDVLDFLDQSDKFYISEKNINFENEIVFNNVSFRYNKIQPFVLNNISLTIKKGSKIGIVGTTGNGKSTFIDLLMGLLSPSSGNFKIDGVEFKSLNFKSWQSKISHVPQSIYLCDASISENIAFGIPKEKINESKIFTSSRIAQIFETILLFKDKFNTNVGERGVKLSGGQKQRIGIARALYSNPEILILDEATSALDTKTESDFINTIQELNRNLTIIAIAHRHSTLKYCDIIYEFKNNEIIFYNSYNDFISKN
jgi:ABC-type multidrug transport system fused ATPase/permease subunit